MRRLFALAFASAVVVAVALIAIDPGDDSDLTSLADSLDVADPARFVAVIETVQQTGRLPDEYVTKREAEALGWRPGSDFCDVAPGQVIGGDRFFNREGRLPEADGRVWFEADIDFACGRRGAKRLVFSNDGLVFVTVDHYDSFVEVTP